MAVFCIPAFVNAASFEMLKYDFEDDVKPICGAAFALNDTVSYSGAKALKFDPNAADNWGLQIEPALTVGDEYTFAAKIKRSILKTTVRHGSSGLSRPAPATRNLPMAATTGHGTP